MNEPMNNKQTQWKLSKEMLLQFTKKEENARITSTQINANRNTTSCGLSLWNWWGSLAGTRHVERGTSNVVTLRCDDIKSLKNLPTSCPS